MSASWELRVVESALRVDAARWDALDGGGSPFLSHAWLAAMEEAGCAAPEQGWLPQFLLAERGGELLGAIPLYVKGNSFGEFVYDWAWADLAARLGVAYYPKLIASSPFSPTSGPRILLHPGLGPEERAEVLRLLIRAAVQLADELGVSSLHFLFVPEEHARVMEAEGLMLRLGHQYHWVNEGYENFDDFLGRFRSKKRVQIKRERRGALEEAGVSVELRRGRELSAAEMDDVFRFYASTCDKFAWGRQYLNRDFFARVHRTMPDDVVAILARRASGEAVGGAFTLERGGRLYGRYWGCDEEVRFLHFEVCCYAPVEWAIREGIRTFEPGAGGGHKYTRGFEPVRTWSAHWVREPRLDGVLRRHLVQERAAVEAEIQRLLEESPLQK